MSHDEDAAQRRDEAERLLQGGNASAAEELLRSVTAADESDPRAWDLLGTARYRMGDIGSAIAAFRRSLALTPSDPDRHYRLAMLLRQIGESDEAQALLRRSLQVRPDFPQAQEALERIDGQSAAPVANTPSAPLSEPPPSEPPPPPDSEVGPGSLQFEGNRLLRSYFAQFAFALALGLVGLVLIAGATVPTGWLSDAFAGVTPKRDRVERLNSLGIDDSAAAADRVALENAQADAARWENRFSDAQVVGGVGLLLLGGMLALRALFSARLTRYRVYERRIDTREGVLRPTANSTWLYEITEIVFRQPLFLLLGGTGRLELTTDRGIVNVTGLETSEKMEALWEEIRDAVKVERREIKGAWL